VKTPRFFTRTIDKMALLTPFSLESRGFLFRPAAVPADADKQGVFSLVQPGQG